MMKEPTQKSAFLAILGRPNVGKSSLINRIVGQKIAIVSNKPQTTRTRIMGVITRGETQLVFLDTPGFHKPHDKLGENMMQSVSRGMSGVEAALLVVDACPKFKNDGNNLPGAEEELLQRCREKKLPTVLVINKIDLLPKKEELLAIINRYSCHFDFDAVIPLSAKTGDGVSLLVQQCEIYARPGVHYFSQDDYTDQPDRVMVAEIIREKMLRRLDREVPHGIAVDLETFSERDMTDGSPIVDISAVIYCERDSHKRIIIGKGGEMLKNIGTLARKDLEQFFGIRVSLKLWVKVKENWRNRERDIRSFGLLGKD